MKQRWLVAAAGVPFLLVVLLACPPWATALLVSAISAVAAYELLHVAGRNVNRAVYVWTICAAVFQVAIVYQERLWYYCEGVIPAGSAHHAPFSPLWAPLWVLSVVLFFLAVVTYGKPRAVTFSTIATGIVGGSVFPMMYSCILLLRMHETYGRLYVLAPFVVAFAGDSLALYCGKWFGRKKLGPVSPNKTWAGCWGNLAGSALGMLVLYLIAEGCLNYRGGMWFAFPLVGAAANLFGQLGDLSTSLIKREHGVKDYSNLFLTHGGVLDRFDSTLFIAPVIYYFVSMGII